MQVYR